MPDLNFCAIDFGTSNSAIAIPTPDGLAMRLVELESGYRTMPTAVFYNAEDESRAYGRAAIAAYVDGFDGRLMRSIKSILGSDLIDETTEIGHGITIKYIDVVIGYLKYLKHTAERAQLADGTEGRALTNVVIGRPVRFVDGDDVRDAKAEDSLRRAAIAAGFADVRFQFEPIAAALDYESTIAKEEIVLVADIGGGTSDFSVVRVGAPHANRQDDILANVGIHIAGTDFDQAVNIAAIMPTLGLGSIGPVNQQFRRVPSKIYFDLATWHLINTVYNHNRLIELREMTTMYADRQAYARLMTVVSKRLGHTLAALAEEAKINVATHQQALISLDAVEAGLTVSFNATQQAEALRNGVRKIVATAVDAAQIANVSPDRVDTLYFTGGSTGLAFLTNEIAAKFPRAKIVSGDRFSSVATGLGITAKTWFGNNTV